MAKTGSDGKSVGAFEFCSGLVDLVVRVRRDGGDGGRRYGQRGADRRGVARIVVVADRQRDVIERSQRVAVFGLKSCQKLRQG
ncbi:MAG: hypothetical protein QOJ56_173 [Mycobacterium sp.]|nr:hypothetical protein [Mycobacterium sp.]